MPEPTQSRWRARRIVAGVFILLVGIAVCVWQGWPHAIAWSNLRQGKVILDTDPQAARVHLERCLQTWPESAEAHFLAARAFRLCGEPGQAAKHIDEAARLGWVPDEVTAERKLLDAEFEQFAVLTRAYISEYRWHEARAVVQRWLELQPDSPAAWSHQGQILERLRDLPKAIDAYRRVVQLSPTDRTVRLELARLIVEDRQSPDEAAEHIEWLLQSDPGNPASRTLLAACREAQGRPDEAVTILNQVIATSPKYARAYYYRGRLELNRSKPAEGVAFLRKAVELDPSDPEAPYSLLLALRQVGTPEEIREVETRWKQVLADLKRAGELGRQIALTPRSADLRHEMGELFLRNGRDAEGLRWLESALRENPDHLPTHRALATYYTRIGRTDLAARHEQFVKARQP